MSTIAQPASYLAQIVAVLSHVFTDSGIMRWMQEPMARLDGHTPWDRLCQGEFLNVLYAAEDYIDSLLGN